jgi:nucleoid-associated protein Lsr2
LISTKVEKMAQKVNIVLVDDIDGTDADETVSFALDGSSYEIDLSSANATALRDALAGYVGHARKVGGRRTPSHRRGAAAAGSSAPSAKEIREWARANGWDVPDRGRVSAEVRSAYTAAH